jgi:DNA primase
MFDLQYAIQNYDLASTIGFSKTGDCPFCQGINKVTNYGSNYYCHKCGENGNVWSWLEKVEMLPKKEIIKRIKNDSFSVSLSKKSEERTAFYQEVLEAYEYGLSRSCEANNYLNTRKFSKDNNHIFRLGYSPSETFLQEMGFRKLDLIKYNLINSTYSDTKEIFKKAIVFPIFDYLGNLRHFQGRYLEPVKLKYLSTQDTSSNTAVNDFLFNENILRRMPLNSTVILTEGAPDTISLNQLGYYSTGCLGLAKLAKHSQKFHKAKKIIAMFDNDVDDMGIAKSWSKVLPQLAVLQSMLPNTQIDICSLPDNNGFKDVNDYLCSECTSDEFRVIVEENSMPLIDKLTKEYVKDLSKHELLIKVYSALNYNIEDTLGKLIQKEFPELYSSPVNYYKAITGKL